MFVTMVLVPVNQQKNQQKSPVTQGAPVPSYIIKWESWLWFRQEQKSGSLPGGWADDRARRKEEVTAAHPIEEA